MSGAPPYDARPADPARRSCPRCGFTVDTTNSPRLAELLGAHLMECPLRPTAQQRRELKAAVKKARFLYGEGAAVVAAERALAGMMREEA